MTSSGICLTPSRSNERVRARAGYEHFANLDTHSDLLTLLEPLYRFMVESAYARGRNEPDICDFVVGNPHEMPLPDFVSALQRWSVPQNKDWFAYIDHDPTARAVVADSRRRRRGVPFEPDDIFLTNGSFAAQAVALHALTDPGDEVIFLSPPWFFMKR